MLGSGSSPQRPIEKIRIMARGGVLGDHKQAKAVCRLDQTTAILVYLTSQAELAAMVPWEGGQRHAIWVVGAEQNRWAIH